MVCQYKGFSMKLLLFLSFFAFSISSAKSLLFPKDFIWGIASASAHVEDELDDIWLAHGREGKIAGFSQTPHPEKRLEFWTKPEKELSYAYELGLNTIRLGVDWERVEAQKGVFNQRALERYRSILKDIKDRGIKVMLTLFHHSEPKWTLREGSWKNPKMISYFTRFSQKVLGELSPYIDYLISFNEAQVYLLLGEVQGLWPSSRGRANKLGFITGAYNESLENMSKAHKNIYQLAKKYKIKTGIAHNYAHYKASSFFSRPIASYLHKKMNLFFPDLIKEDLDFLGVNYYGLESVGLFGLNLSENYLYSDSGRAIFPKGFYMALKTLSKRFPKIPLLVTENGVADETDEIRRPYLLEHLAAVHQAISEGVPVKGYIHWTLSDNLEWADGYCPKFGLISVDRKNHLKRKPRPSFYLYQSVIKNNGFKTQTRELTWKNWLKYTKTHKTRGFCRGDDAITPLPFPIEKPILKIDWRFFPNS